MTEKDSKVKLLGSHGPMVVSSDFPIEAVLKQLGIPHEIKTREQLAKEWLESPWSKPEVIETKPMEIPEGVLDFIDFQYGKKDK